MIQAKNFLMTVVLGFSISASYLISSLALGEQITVLQNAREVEEIEASSPVLGIDLSSINENSIVGVWGDGLCIKESEGEGSLYRKSDMTYFPKSQKNSDKDAAFIFADYYYIDSNCISLYFKSEVRGTYQETIKEGDVSILDLYLEKAYSQYFDLNTIAFLKVQATDQGVSEEIRKTSRDLVNWMETTFSAYIVPSKPCGLDFEIGVPKLINNDSPCYVSPYYTYTIFKIEGGILYRGNLRGEFNGSTPELRARDLDINSGRPEFKKLKIIVPF